MTVNVTRLHGCRELTWIAESVTCIEHHAVQLGGKVGSDALINFRAARDGTTTVHADPEHVSLGSLQTLGHQGIEMSVGVITTVLTTDIAVYNVTLSHSLL